MAKRWTKEEEDFYRAELWELYVTQNQTADEIAPILRLNRSSVCKRLRRLGIQTCPANKPHYLNRRSDIILPEAYSDDIAEFFGILLGDGSLTPRHVCVTLGNKEEQYANYVRELCRKVFGAAPAIRIGAEGYVTLQLSSSVASSWLISEGLAYNKVKAQVDVPRWIFSRRSYMNCLVRGFFDTDGSIYKLKFGIQLSFTNRSKPLLTSLQHILRVLGYRVSAISTYCFYITRISHIKRFFEEIRPRNERHLKRYEMISKSYMAMPRRYSVGGGNGL